MKRLVSIFLTLLIVFNVIGYYGVYLGLRVQANRELKQRLDTGAYDERETLTLKVPVTLPYQSDWHSFERVQGGFEKDGQFYDLVKQKVERDTLIIVYIKDQKETSLFDSLTAFVHASTDTPISKKAGKLIEVFTKDYLATASVLEHSSEGWSMTTFGSRPSFALSDLSSKINAPPPKRIS